MANPSKTLLSGGVKGAIGDKRLSLQKCREILGLDCDLSDSDLERLRDQLYGFAGMVLNTYEETEHKGNLPQFPEVAEILSPDERYTLEERAGIHELDGMASRKEAEALAVNQYIQDHPDLRVLLLGRRHH